MDDITAGRLVKLALLIAAAYAVNRHVKLRRLTFSDILGAPKAALQDLLSELARFFKSGAFKVPIIAALALMSFMLVFIILLAR